MVERIKIKHINILALSLISVFNFIECLIQKYAIEVYLLYVLPFIIVLLLYCFISNLRMDAYVFLMASILSVIVGNWGNLTGAIFVCFALYCFENRKMFFIIIGVTLITIVIKFLINNGTLAQTFNYVIGYVYVIIIYYILMHPKKIIMNMDETNRSIIKLLIEGKKIKDIAGIIYISDNAIRKRIEKMRNKFNYTTNEQLVYNLIEKGYIRLK